MTLDTVSCLFCDLVANDGPATWVARDRDAAAFLPLGASSLAPGHTLVIPTEHVRGVQDASLEVLTAARAMTQKVALAMKAALGAPGVNILNASGPGSEQSVPHLHFHVVPRWPDDGFSTWPVERPLKRLAGQPALALAHAIADLTR